MPTTNKELCCGIEIIIFFNNCFAKFKHKRLYFPIKTPVRELGKLIGRLAYKFCSNEIGLAHVASLTEILSTSSEKFLSDILTRYSNLIPRLSNSFSTFSCK